MAITRKRKIIILAVGVIALLCIVEFSVPFAIINMVANHMENRSPAKQAEMLKIALKVGNLAPIPRSANIKSIRAMGNILDRTFVVEFSADAGTIRKWLDESKGIKTAETKKSADGVRYFLDPRLGYEWADVRVDKSMNAVRISVSHS